MNPAELGSFCLDRAMWNRRAPLKANADRLASLIRAVNWTNDLHPGQWAQWFATVLEFRPDLIIEFGRGKGNSTALFTEAANQLGDCRVVSLCLSDAWQRETAPALRPIVPADWFAPLDARLGNFLSPGIAADLADLASRHRRVLVLWDAHGYAVAEFILGALLPALDDRPHLVLMHDLLDVRYVDCYRDYAGQGVWRGGYDQGDDHSVHVVLGSVVSAVEQAVAITDFTSRNGFPLHSADHELATGLTDMERETLARDLGGLWQLPACWFWFTTNGAGPLTYPTWNPATYSAPDEIARLEERLRAAEKQIRDMEASPFWKVRTLISRLTGKG